MSMIADPYAFETNLFPPAWASPALIEQGWENIYSSAATFSNSSANSYNQPPRKATYSVTNTANTAPTYCYITVIGRTT